jgi:hypothetical protein
LGPRLRPQPPTVLEEIRDVAPKAYSDLDET